jgi:hypothetical protein
MIVSNANDNTLYGRQQTLFACSIKAITKFGHHVVALPDFNGNADGDCTWTIPRSGDLVMGAWFHCVIPGLASVDADNKEIIPVDMNVKAYRGEDDAQDGSLVAQEDAGKDQVARYCDGVGFYLMKEVSLEIGGSMISRCYSHMLKIWDELTCKPGRRVAQDEMTGSGRTRWERIVRSQKARRLIVGLDALTFFNHQPCLALPLVSIPFHTSKLKITMNKLVDAIEGSVCAKENDCSSGSGIKTIVRPGQSVSDYKSSNYSGIIAKSCASDNIPYQRNFANATEITSSKRNGDLGIFPEVTVKYILLDKDERQAYAKRTASYIIQQWQSQIMLSVDSNTKSGIYKDQINLAHPMSSMFWVARSSFHRDRNSRFNYFGIQDLYTGLYQPIFSKFNLYFNNSPIFEHAGSGNQEELWFSGVENYGFTNTPNTGLQIRKINSYNASLDPENTVQPAGSLNLSRIDTVHMYAEVQANAFDDQTSYTLAPKITDHNEDPIIAANMSAGTAELLVYVKSYNVLRVQNGLAGLEYQL